MLKPKKEIRKGPSPNITHVNTYETETLVTVIDNIAITVKYTMHSYF